MKQLVFSAVLMIMFFAGGYYVGKGNREIKVVNKIDTVKVEFVDTVYKFKAIRHFTRDTVYSVDRDTINNIIHDTVYVVYSSPFRLGNDSLNCTGIVSFDMKRFVFDNVSFKYPRNTYIVNKPVYVCSIRDKAEYTLLGTAIGVIVGVLVK